ncbi:MAG: MinD/ParA family protein, partial [Bdellovibrionales bacterium]|nr:MinD/ParA family protein [Bdellovibrionales bacterium]
MSFTSGKGGVGKSHLVSNTAVGLSQKGRRVLILDADLGLANIDVILGLNITKTIHDFLEGRSTLEELIVEGPAGVHVIPASSGVESILQLSQQERLGLLQAIEQLADDYDYLLIDTPAGIGPDVLSFTGASQEIVCVITPEPTSLTDAYALIKVLSRRFGERNISVLVNNVKNEKNAQRTFKRFDEVVHQYLQVELNYLGWIARDEVVLEATRLQKPFLLEFPSERASRGMQRLVETIDGTFYETRVKGGVQFFFKQ